MLRHWKFSLFFLLLGFIALNFFNSTLGGIFLAIAVAPIWIRMVIWRFTWLRFVEIRRR